MKNQIMRLTVSFKKTTGEKPANSINDQTFII